MLLIVILNAVLAATVVGVIFALHARAIAAEHTARRAEPATLWALKERPATSAAKPAARAQRRPPALAAAR